MKGGLGEGSDSQSLADEFPKVNFLEKAIQLSADFDRSLTTIYSALIAGVVLLLLKEEVTFWAGACLVLALACFILGIGHTLLHIAFTSKLLFLAEAIKNGTKIVPNFIEREEPTALAYARTQAWAQCCYSSQLIYLLIGVSIGALGIFARLWEYMSRAGVLLLLAVASISMVAAIAATWKKAIRRFRAPRGENEGL